MQGRGAAGPATSPCCNIPRLLRLDPVREATGNFPELHMYGKKGIHDVRIEMRASTAFIGILVSGARVKPDGSGAIPVAIRKQDVLVHAPFDKDATKRFFACPMASTNPV